MSLLDRRDFRTVLAQQGHLYERAFQEPETLRLSERVLAYDPSGDDGFACDPDFPAYPAEVERRIRALPRGQHAALTRVMFALEKQNVAQNEMITLTWNTRCAIRAFGVFTAGYWVQHRETLDEYDHIYGFELLCRKLLGGGLSADELARKNRFREAALQGLEPRLRDKNALPALYFTLRFLANISLKMVEGFCFDPRRADVGYSEPLRAINQTHHDDEARHFTSSWSFGRELYLRIDDPREKELVRAVVALYLELHVRSLPLGGHLYRTAYEALAHAIERRALPDLGLSLDGLRAAYEGPGATAFADLSRSRRREAYRWAASQLRKLEVALELGPDDYDLRWVGEENSAVLRELAANALANGTSVGEDLDPRASYEAYLALLGER